MISRSSCCRANSESETRFINIHYTQCISIWFYLLGFFCSPQSNLSLLSVDIKNKIICKRLITYQYISCVYDIFPQFLDGNFKRSFLDKM